MKTSGTSNETILESDRGSATVYAIVSLTVGVLVVVAIFGSLWTKNQRYTDIFRDGLQTNNNRLGQIEKTLSALEKAVDGLSGQIPVITGAGEGASGTELLRQLATQSSRDIPDFTVLVKTVKRLENFVYRLEAMDRGDLAGLMPADPMPMPVPPENFSPITSTDPPSEERQMSGWFFGLSREKQAHVEQTFRKHAEFIRNQMSFGRDPGQIGPDQMQEDMEFSRNFLLDQLEGILEPDELDTFMQEFPIPDARVP